MTLRELVEAIESQGGGPDTEIVLYIKSETYVPEVVVSEEDDRAYLIER